MGFWSRAPPALTQEYQESVAHRVRDILTGESHSSHKRAEAIRDKQALKALQRPEALAGVIEILKNMPEPDHDRAEGWEVDEGVDVDSEQEESKEEEVKERKVKYAAVTGTAAVAIAATAAAVAAKASSSSGSRSSAGGASSTALTSAAPKGTTIVAATTIAAAAATSAVAATLAVTLRGPSKKVVVNEDGETITTTTKTEVRFHPSKSTVSSQAYWWGYEIFIPQVALSRIASAQDVSSAFLGFLGSVGLIVPAIVPFLGYIAAYVGLEFAVIKAQNEGKGVILASTWLVPVALVPRAWDVPEEEGVDGASGRVK
ncbi:hypothetical protein BGZ96_009898 [Linnemannia gamsii]|uniref:Uncharacterized protein n=1 Tax=Linnemannia gamsii TaxID=64522 RepID=A0ABQ7JWG5_9FUNG|nr:hypothetical protein BGZ96_009898 [Linnemannia gamsii]